MAESISAAPIPPPPTGNTPPSISTSSTAITEEISSTQPPSDPGALNSPHGAHPSTTHPSVSLDHRNQNQHGIQHQIQHQDVNSEWHLYTDISEKGKWSVSSFKFGFGSECLKDDDPETFWHSDGPQPHYITVEFPRKIAIQKLSILLNFSKDDSYTPSVLHIRAGTAINDLQEVRIVMLDKPDGWITFDVSNEPDDDAYGTGDEL